MERREYKSISVEERGHVVTLMFNRPEKKNPLSQEAINELLWALDDAESAPDVRVVVLTGAGNAFSAGADLKGMSGDRSKGLEKKGEFDDLLTRLSHYPKPLVARIPGYVMGGAMGIVACCHFAVACDSAILATPEIKRGLFPMMIMAVLRRVIPERHLIPLMLLGDRISAEQARDIGLLTDVVPDDELDSRVTALTEKLAQQSPTAMRMGLQAFRKQETMTVDEALPFLRDQLYAILQTEDAKEGLAAFFEKREPRWTGR